MKRQRVKPSEERRDKHLTIAVTETELELLKSVNQPTVALRSAGLASARDQIKQCPYCKRRKR